MFLRSDGEPVITSHIKRSTIGPLKKGTILGGPYYLMLRLFHPALVWYLCMYREESCCLEIGLPWNYSKFMHSSFQKHGFYQLFFCDIFELTSMWFIFSTGTTSCPEDLNWDCKGWKEGPVKCSWNRMLQLFLVMELVNLVCRKGWIDTDGVAPIFIPLFDLSKITVLPLV